MINKEREIERQVEKMIIFASMCDPIRINNTKEKPGFYKSLI
jgi:hypothetical protein